MKLFFALCALALVSAAHAETVCGQLSQEANPGYGIGEQYIQLTPTSAAARSEYIVTSSDESLYAELTTAAAGQQRVCVEGGLNRWRQFAVTRIQNQ